MNHTKSGCIAVGAANSRARILAEAEYAKEKQAFQLLLLSDEGRLVLAAALRGVGCDPQLMTDDGFSECCEKYYSEICQFIGGMKFMSDKF